MRAIANDRGTNPEAMLKMVWTCVSHRSKTIALQIALEKTPDTVKDPVINTEENVDGADRGGPEKPEIIPWRC